MRSRRSLRRSKALLRIILPATAVLAAAQQAVAGSVNSTWTGAAGSTSYDTSGNWDPSGVPINSETDTYNVSIPNNVSVIYDVGGPQLVTDLVLGVGATFTVAAGKSLTVLDDAKIGGLLVVDTGSFIASSAAAQFTGNAARLQASGGGAFTVAATSYTAAGLGGGNYTLFSATGAGTAINVSSLQTLSDAWDDGWGGVRVHTISASNSAAINLSKVQNLVGPVRGEDRLDIVTASGASIDFSGLQSITGAGQVRFITDGTAFSLASLASCSILSINVGANATVDLPALTTASAFGVTAGDSSVVNLPVLTTLANSNISLANNQTINAPNLKTFTGSSLTLGPNQTLNAPAFTTIDNSSFILSGGKTLAVNTPTYSAVGVGASASLISLSGSGTSLDFSTVKTLNDGFNDSWGGVNVHTISVASNASLDLSNTQNIISPARGEDRLDFVVSSGGSVNLTSLQTITGAGQVRFVVDSPTFTLPVLTAASGVTFVMSGGSTLGFPLLETADRTALNVPNSGTFNANALKTLTNSSITLGTGGTLNATSLRTFTSSSLTLGGGQTLNAPGFTNIDNSVFAISGGATFASPVTAYNATGLAGSSTLLNVSGAGSTMDLSAAQTFNDAWNDSWGGVQVHTISVSGGGTINLSNVSTLIAPARAEDRLDIVMGSGGTVNLAKLQSITGAGQVRFVSDAATFTLPMLAQAAGLSFAMNASSVLSLPALTNADRSAFTVPASGTFNLPLLTTLTNSSIDLAAAATFNAPSLKSFTNGTLSLNTGSNLNTPAFTNINNSRITLTGGATLTAAVPDYSATALGASYTLFNVSGAGSALDLSSVLNFSDAWDDGWGGTQVHTISVTNGGTINLGNLQILAVPVRAEDRLDLVTGTGGTINLAKLQSFVGSGQVRVVSDAANLTLPGLASANGLSFAMNAGSTVSLPVLASADRATLAVPDAGTFNLPQLAILTNSSIAVGTGGTFSAPKLKTFTGGSLSLGANQTLNVPAFTSFNNTGFTLSGGVTYAVAAPVYSATALNGAATLISLSGSGTSLDFSSVRTFNDGWDDSWGGTQVHTLSVSNNASLNLSNTQTLISPARAEDRLDIVTDSGGFVDLSSLTSITKPGQTRFVVGGGSSIRVGDVKSNQNVGIYLSDVTSSFRAIGSLLLGNNTLSAAAGSKITIGRHFTHSATDEAKVNTTSAIVQLVGPGAQSMEVAGKDSGLPTDALPAHNFAIGQLVVGSDEQPSVVELLDVVDNGNRGGSGGNTEALYLPGLGGPDGLVLKAGSTLVLGSVNVYYREGATWKRLNDLLSAGGPTPVGPAYISSSRELVPNAWNLDANGTWSPDANWVVGAPNQLGLGAYFGAKATASRTVTVDSDKTIGVINFDNASGYTVAGPGTIKLQVAGDTRAAINVTNRNGNGNHRIEAALQLNSPLWISQESTGQLTLAGPLNNAAGQTVAKWGAGEAVISGAQTHGAGARILGYEGTLRLKSDAGTGLSRTASVEAAGGTIVLETAQHLASAYAYDGKIELKAGRDKVIVADEVGLGVAGKIDLMDNAMVVPSDAGNRDGVLQWVAQQVKSGRNTSPLWQGAGITSSKAAANGFTGLAAVINDNGEGVTLVSNVLGEKVGVNDIIVGFVWNGDGNLDGVINADDYFRIDSGYITQKGGWCQGEFNYDGVVNADDYFLIDSAYIGQSGAMPLEKAGMFAGRGVAVPEVGGMGLGLLGVGMMWKRRRRGRDWKLTIGN
ncbi:MAG: hypothetical protein NTU53_07280 [Planctomycetota bacterium]|nr:hypothetical protein [Planctomycetota bacterium]